MTELGLNIPSLVAYLINFVVLLGILIVFAYKPLNSAIDQRAEIQAQINEARVEAQKILDQARSAADRFREERMAQAQEEAIAFTERAKSDIETERDSASRELRESFGELAIDAAEAVVKKTLDADSHKDLIDQILEESTSAGGKLWH